MYDLETVITFIERTNNVKLYEYQKVMLQAIIEGKIFSCPIRSGRSFILRGFCEYLRSFHGGHKSYDESEVHVTLNNVLEENIDRFKFNKTDIEIFKREYECDWADKEQ